MPDQFAGTARSRRLRKAALQRLGLAADPADEKPFHRHDEPSLQGVSAFHVDDQGELNIAYPVFGAGAVRTTTELCLTEGRVAKRKGVARPDALLPARKGVYTPGAYTAPCARSMQGDRCAMERSLATATPTSDTPAGCSKMRSEAT